MVGFRRSRKTYLFLSLVKKFGKENCLYINFEDERIPRNTEALTALLASATEFYSRREMVFLLDEIQNMPNWSLWARRLLENTNHKIFISGSSSKLSSFELPTELRGRSLGVYVVPLNFSEFLRFKNFRTFLVRDIKERHKIRNEEVLKETLRLLLNSSYFTVSRLNNNLKSLGYKSGKSTIVRYLEYFRESFFCDYLYVHHPSVKNRMKAPKKPYFADSFFLSHFAGSFSENLGRLMENAVYQKIKTMTMENSLLETFYFKDYQGHEVDFIVREKEEVKKIIQVSYVSKEQDINKREMDGLLIALKLFKKEKAILITWDLDKTIKKDSHLIECIPLIDFLTGRVSTFILTNYSR